MSDDFLNDLNDRFKHLNSLEVVGVKSQLHDIDDCYYMVINYSDMPVSVHPIAMQLVMPYLPAVFRKVTPEHDVEANTITYRLGTVFDFLNTNQ